MKQCISKKQWDELDKIDKIKFVEAIDAQIPEGEGLGITWTFKRDFRPNIGQMIEFLSDIYEQDMRGDWRDAVEFEYNGMKVFPDTENLCDTLWEATKEVLEK